MKMICFNENLSRIGFNYMQDTTLLSYLPREASTR